MGAWCGLSASRALGSASRSGDPMPRIVVSLALAALLCASNLGTFAWLPALAQDAPPDIGATVLEDGLTAPGLVQSLNCPSGRGSGAFENEGYTIKASGGCQSAGQPAGIGADIRGMSMPDG